MGSHLYQLSLLMISLISTPTQADTFQIDFFDASGASVGTGTYSFDTITPNTNTAFDSLSNLNWNFNLPVYDIAISSAAGDSSSRESTAQEGVFTLNLDDALTLRFFDNVGQFVSHNDESALPLRTSVRFIEFSNSVAYIKDDVSLGTGTYVATLIPTPSTSVMAASMFAWATVRRRTN